MATKREILVRASDQWLLAIRVVDEIYPVMLEWHPGPKTFYLLIMTHFKDGNLQLNVWNSFSRFRKSLRGGFWILIKQPRGNNEAK